MTISKYVKSLIDDYFYENPSGVVESSELVICPNCGEAYRSSEFFEDFLSVKSSDVLDDKDYRFVEAECGICHLDFFVKIEMKYTSTRVDFDAF